MKKRMNLITMFVFSVIALLQSCGKSVFCDDEKLSWKKQNNPAKVLKTNGYYYGNVNTTTSSPFADICYLYLNGVFYTSFASDLYKAKSGTIYVDTTNSLGKQTQDAWGVYKINNNIIEIDRWLYSLSCIKRIYEKGEIINDTTFNINYRETHFNGKRESAETVNSIFYFKPLLQKPDSTNNYVK
jgi:hypothetical protein